jgi:hypothetical protein
MKYTRGTAPVGVVQRHPNGQRPNGQRLVYAKGFAGAGRPVPPGMWQDGARGLYSHVRSADDVIEMLEEEMENFRSVPTPSDLSSASGEASDGDEYSDGDEMPVVENFEEEMERLRLSERRRSA